MSLVGEHSYRAGGKIWKMCRWSYPICSARYPSDQVLFGTTEGAVAGAEILEMPYQKEASKIEN
jgi:hypothetical protein